MPTRVLLLATAAAAVVVGCRSTVQGAAEVPQPPVTVTAISTLARVEVCWSAVAGASVYELDYSTDAALAGATPTFTNATCQSAASLDTAATWYFGVRATVGTGAAAVVTARTKPIAAARPGETDSMGPPTWTWNGYVPANEFGGAIFPAGDLNGDGWPDFAVAGLNGLTSRVQVLLGGPAVSPTDLDSRMGCAFSADGVTGTSALAGWAMTHTDLDGDGYSDLFVGTPRDATNGYVGGQVRILGGAAGGGCKTDLSVQGATVDGGFGRSVAAWRGKWYVGHPGDDKVVVFSGLSSTQLGTLDGTAGTRFGWAMATFGPVPGDTLPALAVGAPDLDSRSGVVEVHALGAITPESGTENQGQLGTVLADAGDVDGDQRDDLLVGTGPRDFANGPRAFVMSAASAGTGVMTMVFQGTKPLSTNGVPLALAGAGDVDGDGYDDVLIGDPMYANGTGRVVLLRGGPGGIDPARPPLWVAYGEATGQHFGAAVAGIGDADGDGFPDIAVGVPNHGTGDEGEVQVWRGHSRWGITVTPGPTLSPHRGDYLAVPFTFSDPIGLGPWNVSVDCDDGTGYSAPAPFDPGNLPSCTLGSLGRHEIRVRVLADDGRFGEALLAVKVTP